MDFYICTPGRDRSIDRTMLVRRLFPCAPARGVVNVSCADRDSVRLSVLAALFPVRTNSGRPAKYRAHERSRDWTGLQEAWPPTPESFDAYERANPTDALIVLACTSAHEDRRVIRLSPRTSSDDIRNVVHLAAVTFDDGLVKYVWVKNVDRFFRAGASNRSHRCPACIERCNSPAALAAHMARCGRLPLPPPPLPAVADGADMLADADEDEDEGKYDEARAFLRADWTGRRTLLTGLHGSGVTDCLLRKLDHEYRNLRIGRGELLLVVPHVRARAELLRRAASSFPDLADRLTVHTVCSLAFKFVPAAAAAGSVQVPVPYHAVVGVALGALYRGGSAGLSHEAQTMLGGARIVVAHDLVRPEELDLVMAVARAACSETVVVARGPDPAENKFEPAPDAEFVLRGPRRRPSPALDVLDGISHPSTFREEGLGPPPAYILVRGRTLAQIGADLCERVRSAMAEAGGNAMVAVVSPIENNRRGARAATGQSLEWAAGALGASGLASEHYRTGPSASVRVQLHTPASVRGLEFHTVLILHFHGRLSPEPDWAMALSRATDRVVCYVLASQAEVAPVFVRLAPLFAVTVPDVDEDVDMDEGEDREATFGSIVRAARMPASAAWKDFLAGCDDGTVARLARLWGVPLAGTGPGPGPDPSTESLPDETALAAAYGTWAEMWFEYVCAGEAGGGPPAPQARTLLSRCAENSAARAYVQSWFGDRYDGQKKRLAYADMWYLVVHEYDHRVPARVLDPEDCAQRYGSHVAALQVYAERIASLAGEYARAYTGRNFQVPVFFPPPADAGPFLRGRADAVMTEGDSEIVLELKFSARRLATRSLVQAAGYVFARARHRYAHVANLRTGQIERFAINH